MSEAQLLRTWRLDEVREADRVVSSGSQIKDRYTLTFRAQGGYSQILLDSGDEFQGTWQLTGSGHRLELTDHKGDKHSYDINGTWPNGGAQPEKITLYGPVKDQVLHSSVFNLVP